TCCSSTARSSPAGSRGSSPTSAAATCRASAWPHSLPRRTSRGGDRARARARGRFRRRDQRRLQAPARRGLGAAAALASTPVPFAPVALCLPKLVGRVSLWARQLSTFIHIAIDWTHLPLSVL